MFFGRGVVGYWFFFPTYEKDDICETGVRIDTDWKLLAWIQLEQEHSLLNFAHLRRRDGRLHTNLGGCWDMGFWMRVWVIRAEKRRRKEDKKGKKEKKKEKRRKRKRKRKEKKETDISS